MDMPVPEPGKTTKKKRKNLDTFKKAKIVTLRGEGYSYREIAAKVNCSHGAVKYTCTRHAETGSVAERKRSGRPRKITPRQDRELVRISLHNRKANSKEIKQEFTSIHNINLHPSTVRRRLIKAGLVARRPVKKPLLNPVNIAKRLDWAKAHRNWTPEQWEKVLWSDESPYELFTPDKKAFVRRRPGERFHADCIIPTVKRGGGSIMVWGCMSAGGVGSIQRVKGRIDSEKYMEILDQSMLDSAHAQFGNEQWIFQQDNAPCHTSKRTQQYFIRNRVDVMPWPPQSPDLNPIEHLWEELERQLTRKQRPTSLDNLYYLLNQCWYEIPESVCRHLVESMPRRIEAVIKAKGGSTKY